MLWINLLIKVRLSLVGHFYTLPSALTALSVNSVAIPAPASLT